MAIAAPAIVATIYVKRGMKKRFTVPRHLHYVPNPLRKPWEVDLVFCGNALTMGPNALYATLLDLNRRGFIEIEAGEDNVVLKMLRWTEDLDDYERSVMLMIKEFGVGEEVMRAMEKMNVPLPRKALIITVGKPMIISMVRAAGKPVGGRGFGGRAGGGFGAGGGSAAVGAEQDIVGRIRFILFDYTRILPTTFSHPPHI